MSDIRQLEFWSDEERRAWDDAAPVLLEVVLAGGMSGERGLPPAMRALIDWNWFNQAALDWLKGYRGGIWSEIAGHTRQRTLAIVEDWVRAGEALPVLEAKLERLYSRQRARTIAVTEITRMYAEGNIMSWEAAGVVGGKRWSTARDDKVCAICGPLDGMIVGLREDGFATKTSGLGIYAPPAHPMCRCWLTPVVSEDLLRDQLRKALGRFGDLDGALRDVYAWRDAGRVVVV